MNSTIATTEPKWMANARQLVGLKEIVGSQHEKKVLEFFAEAGHPEIHNDETAWCAAFANAMLRRAGYAGTGSLAARSFLTWGEKLTTPRPGCVAVFKRGNSSWEGHVAFFVRDAGDSIEVLGGNQSNSVSITRMPKSSLLGYRWPLIVGAPAAKPKPAPVKESVKATVGVAVGVGTAGGAKAAVDAGWGASEWSMLAGGMILLCGLGWLAWRYGWPAFKAWRARPASIDRAGTVGLDAVGKALPSAGSVWLTVGSLHDIRGSGGGAGAAPIKTPPKKRRAPRKPAAKPKGKKKPAKRKVA